MSCTVRKEKRIEPNWYWFLIIAVIGLALRLTELGKQSLWLDEMTSIQVALKPLEKILTGQGFDNFTPPLYYVLLHFWSRLVPLTEVTLRLPSAIIDFCNIFLLIALSRRFISKTATFLVVSAYAISPFMLYYSQEGRMYTLAVFFALAFCLALERVVRAETHLIPWTFISGVLLALGVYTHYYIAFFAVGVMSLAVFVIRHSPKRILLVLLSGITGVLLFAPWIPVVKVLVETGSQNFRKFIFTVIPYAYFRFVVGYAVFPLNMYTKEHFLPEVLSHAPHIIAVFGTLLFLLYNIIIDAGKKKLLFITSLFLIVAIPLLIGLLRSLKSPMLSERYLIITLPFFFLLFLGCLDIGYIRAKMAVIIFFVLMIAGDLAYFMNPDFGKAQWREAAGYVTSIAGEKDVIFIEPEYVSPVFQYYFRGNRTLHPSILKYLKEDIQSPQNNRSGEITKKGRAILVTSGNEPGKGYTRVLSNIANKRKTKIFPLETGIICTIWEFKKNHSLAEFEVYRAEGY